MSTRQKNEPWQNFDRHGNRKPTSAPVVQAEVKTAPKAVEPKKETVKPEPVVEPVAIAEVEIVNDAPTETPEEAVDNIFEGKKAKK